MACSNFGDFGIGRISLPAQNSQVNVFAVQGSAETEKTKQGGEQTVTEMNAFQVGRDAFEALTFLSAGVETPQ